jgi:excinuclease ABC subunit C
LKFRACKKSLDLLNEGKPQTGAPCLDHQIGKCNGLCVSALTQEEYRSRIDEVERFFRGNFAATKKRAEENMKAASLEKKFERAARLRDVVRFIEDLEKKQVVSDASGENADVFGIALSHGKIQVVLLREREEKRSPNCRSVCGRSEARTLSYRLFYECSVSH